MNSPALLGPLSLVFLLAGGALRAQEAPDASRLRAKIYAAAPVFVAPYTDTESLTAPLRDIRAHLKSKGIEIPPDGEATYDKENLTVTVRAPQAVLKQVDALVPDPGWFQVPRRSIRLIFTTVDFRAENAVEQRDMSYEGLRKAAGASWRVLDRHTLLGGSGQKATSQRVQNNLPAKAGAQRPLPKASVPREGGFGPDAYGAIAEAEPQLGEAGQVEVAFTYLYRSRGAGEDVPFFAEIRGSVSMKLGVPVLIHTATLLPPTGTAPAPARELAVILEATLVGDPVEARAEQPKFPWPANRIWGR